MFRSGLRLFARIFLGPPYASLTRREFIRACLFLFGVRGILTTGLGRLLIELSGVDFSSAPERVPATVAVVALLLGLPFIIPYCRLLYGRLVWLGFPLPRLAACLIFMVLAVVSSLLPQDSWRWDLIGLGLSVCPFLPLLPWPDRPRHAPEPRHPTADLIATACFLALLFL